MASININTDALVVFANKLEKIGRSDLPVVINQTLNNAAFDVKQRTLLQSTSSEFTIRQKRFFSGTSTVKKSTGFNINTMKSQVGFKGGSTNPAVKDLEKQEHGGSLKRSFIANDDARVGGKSTGNIKKENRMSIIKTGRFVDAAKSKGGGNNKSKFIKAAFYAKKTGRNYVLGAYKTKTGRRTLYRIDKMQSSVKTRKTTFKSTGILTVKKGSQVEIKATRFMSKATHKSSKRMEQHFIKNAKNRLKI